MSPEEHAAWDRIGQLSRKGFEDQEGIFAIIDLSLGGPASGVMNPADVNIYYGAEAANFLQGYAFRKALGHYSETVMDMALKILLTREEKGLIEFLLEIFQKMDILLKGNMLMI